MAIIPDCTKPSYIVRVTFLWILHIISDEFYQQRYVKCVFVTCADISIWGCPRASKWGRLYADVWIWGVFHVETSSSRSQYMQFRPLIDKIECGLVGKTSWMTQLTDLKFISCMLSMHALILIKCVTELFRNLTTRYHEKSVTSRLGKCWREEHNTV